MEKFKGITQTSEKKDVTNLGKGVVSIQRDHRKTMIQAQCCKPGPCSPKG